MVNFDELIGIQYLIPDYFRGGESGCSDTRSLYMKILNNSLEFNSKYPIYKLINLSRNFYSFKSTIHGKDKNRKKIWFGPDTTRYIDIILKLAEEYEIFIFDYDFSKTLWLKSIYNKNINFFAIMDYANSLNYGIVNDDKESLYKGIDGIKSVFKELDLDLVVVHDDIFPISRAITLVAKDLGIPTVEIQHGIYLSKYTPTGIEADYVFVWGEYFKNLYLNNQIKPPQKLKILGYPFTIKDVTKPHESINLIYLGQNTEEYAPELINQKIETVEKLNNICEKLNIQFSYRPHPGDDVKLLKEKMANIKFTKPGETLDESFQKGDIFVGFDSTALVEATLHSKISLQLKSYSLPTDDFEKIGACTRTFDNYDDLKTFLEKIKTSKNSFISKPDNRFIETRNDPGNRFAVLIKDIL